MDETYRTVNALTDNLRQVAAPSIPKLKIEFQLIKIKHMLLIIEAQHEKPSGVQALLLRLKSVFDVNLGNHERLLPLVTEIAEEFTKLAYKEGTRADRRKGAGGPTLMRRKEDRL
jgi:hypothetical protein